MTDFHLMPKRPDLDARAREIQFELLQERQKILDEDSKQWYERSVNNPSTGVYIVYVSMPSNEQYRADILDLGGMLIQKYSKEELWRQKALKRAAELFKDPGMEFRFTLGSLDPMYEIQTAKYATTPEEFVQLLEDPRYSLPRLLQFASEEGLEKPPQWVQP